MLTEEMTPKYGQMLSMPEEDFKKLLLVRLEHPHRQKLLGEMIEHEERTHSAEKTMLGKEINQTTRMVLDVFNREKSKEIVELLEKTRMTLAETTQDATDLVRDAMLAKATSDFVHLGTQREFQSLTKPSRQP